MCFTVFLPSPHRTFTQISKSDLHVYVMFMPMAMFFYVLFYVSMPFNEERTEFKKMQPISPFIYWTSVYLFDATIHVMYSYLMYLAHIWCDVNHIFDAREYGECSDTREAWTGEEREWRFGDVWRHFGDV